MAWLGLIGWFIGIQLPQRCCDILKKERTASRFNRLSRFCPHDFCKEREESGLTNESLDID